MSLENKQIRFPEKCYVTSQGRVEDGMPLGFMTEDGTDAAAIKRKETADRWAGSGKSSFPPRSYDNKPMVGFRLTRSIRRDSSWGSGNVKWRIEDPRGFELEISSPNMAQVILNSVIENGEILAECIWARLKGDNVLVPVNSSLYQTTKENSERLGKSVSLKEVKVGNEIVLQNGTKGVYLGKLYRIEAKYDRSRYDSSALTNFGWSAKPDLVLDTGKNILTMKSMKVAEITNPSTLTPAQAEKRANSYQSGNYSEKPTEIGKRELVPVNLPDVSGRVFGMVEEYPVYVSAYYLNNKYGTSAQMFTSNPLETGDFTLARYDSFYNTTYKTIDIKNMSWAGVQFYELQTPVVTTHGHKVMLRG
jgi:hypothetical protein